MKNLRLVIDTNVFLVALSRRGKYHWLYELISENKIQVLLSNPILTEYYEICSQKYPAEIIKELLEPLTNFSNTIFIDPVFNWSLITADPDDDKFVDCAVAGNADYIISNDSDFRVLKRIEFPKVTVLTLEEFEQKFRKLLFN